MYTFSEFVETIEKIREENVKFDYRNVVIMTEYTDLMVMYGNIKNIVNIGDIYDYLYIWTFVKQLAIFHKGPDIPEDVKLDLKLYELFKKLPNLSINKLLGILSFIFIKSIDQSYSYRYMIRTYPGGVNAAVELYKEINSSDKTYKSLMDIFTKEAVRCNNDKVSPLSWLWWEQNSNCYTLWLPRELVSDIMELLQEKHDYTTFVELF